MTYIHNIHSQLFHDIVEYKKNDKEYQNCQKNLIKEYINYLSEKYFNKQMLIHSEAYFQYDHTPNNINCKMLLHHDQSYKK